MTSVRLFVSSKFSAINTSLFYNLVWVLKGHTLHQLNLNGTKTSFFANYDKSTNICWIEELQNWKPVTPIFSSSAISRKQQAAGFWAVVSVNSCPLTICNDSLLACLCIMDEWMDERMQEQKKRVITKQESVWHIQAYRVKRGRK